MRSSDKLSPLEPESSKGMGMPFVGRDLSRAGCPRGCEPLGSSSKPRRKEPRSAKKTSPSQRATPSKEQVRTNQNVVRVGSQPVENNRKTNQSGNESAQA